MSKKKEKQRNSTLRTLRKIKNLTLIELNAKCRIGVSLICSFENNKILPSREAVVKISEGLEVNPDILLLSFGYLPESEMNIIRSDPYYYMDKIQKICKNHATRYSEENTNIDDLNIARTYDYIIKSMEDRKRDDKGNT